MKKYLFLFVFTHFLLASCCKTNVDPSHVNKFTCKVNGVFWEAIPLERSILGNDLRIDKSPFFEYVFLHARNSKKEQSVTFGFSLSDTAKISVINNSNPFSNYGGGCEGYNLDTLTSHTVTVTEHDKTKQIVKGIFSFRAINSDIGCKDTVIITDGFFNMRY